MPSSAEDPAATCEAASGRLAALQRVPIGPRVTIDVAVAEWMPATSGVPLDGQQLQKGPTLSDAQLRQALIDAGHPSTGPGIPHLYPVARRDDADDTVDH